ncbi:surface-adhesin E family protein [Achromobacter sp.]|uniref:surface-adhesin E family protein n=1 Tax=Achromobacter sp. TaxID=134375 RepID=UPI0028ADB214|nr:surface-adhesin E family protein [Achromobacter sp.]
MTARPPTALLTLALFLWASGGAMAQTPADKAMNWVPVDPQAMPGVFYDSNSIQAVSERPTVMAVTVAWFYAQPRVSEANGQPYGSVTQPIMLNCGNNTYTVTEVRHHAGNNATGAIVESIPVAGILNAPVTRDPVQRRLRDLVCDANGKSARK